MNEDMIVLDGIRKRFGRFTALDGVSLRVAPGEAVALWGPNGAGKSTLVRCLLGLLDFQGEATVAGLDVRRDGRAVRGLIGYLPQEPALFDDLRLAEATLFFARLRGVADAEARRMLVGIGLDEHVRKRVRELSGGMKQRLALGLALLGDPPVLVLDEPTSNLDEVARGELLEEVDRLRRRGKTVLLISHRPEEVRRIADRIVTLESGRILRIDVANDGETNDTTSDPLVVERPVGTAAFSSFIRGDAPTPAIRSTGS
ncbi:MAG: ABC transporter ATP-binding protein [Phycisphaeraceae bacterium]|nr:ABC transporter ATP-binding protein [Phycisphaeraceae bacterium]